MATYRIGTYQGVCIECWTPKELVGLHSLLKQEGCPDSENVFSDNDKAIASIISPEAFRNERK